MWGGPDGWAALLENGQTPDDRSILESVEYLFVLFISLGTHLTLFRAPRARSPGFLDQEGYLWGRR